MGRLNFTRSGIPDDRVSAELLDRCRSGDERAWNELVRATHRDVYTVCLRILGDPDDASEATQETFVKVWRGLSRFREEAQFTTWLYRVATNTAISRHRSRKRRRMHEVTHEEHNEIDTSGDTTAAAAGARLDLERLQNALQSLPDMYRIPVVLRDVYGLPIAEVAERLRISETAAKVRIHRGRKRLRDRAWPSDEEAG